MKLWRILNTRWSFFVVVVFFFLCHHSLPWKGNVIVLRSEFVWESFYFFKYRKTTDKSFWHFFFNVGSWETLKETERNYKDNLYNLVNYIKYNSNDLREILKKKITHHQRRNSSGGEEKRGNGNFYDWGLVL